MAKTFYGYAEREADSFVDWSQIGKDITKMLQTEVQLREDKKQALEDATRAYEEQLANAPQGEYTDANEYISNFSNDATQAMLMQERLLKTGQLKVKDYVLARDNLVSGTNQMFKIAEEYQTAYSEGMKRWKNEESSYREFWQLLQAEGLANFQNTRAMINPTNFKVSIAKMIKKMADDGTRVNLALSLHAADDIKRNAIMAINESNNLDTLVEALNYFFDVTKGNKLTFEYIAFDDFNESIEDAKKLLSLCRRVPSVKVNIIEYNQVEGVTLHKADTSKTDQFAAYLKKNGISATIRRSRGKDIDAACGQLANK